MPSNDFSLYDHVLDTTVMLGAIPDRFRAAVPGRRPADARWHGYFAMARGTDDVAPLEMTKWFDTNYHYLVPELGPGHRLRRSTRASRSPSSPRPSRSDSTARPVLVGPVTFLLLAKPAPGSPPDFDPLALLDRLLPRLRRAARRRCARPAREWVQLDEPALVQDRTPPKCSPPLTGPTASLGRRSTDRPKLLVASYFDRLGDALPVLAEAPIDGLALDFTGPAAANLRRPRRASAGCPASAWSPGWSTAATSGSTTCAPSLATLGTLLGLADRVDVAAVLLPAARAAGRRPPRRTSTRRSRRWLAFARQKTRRDRHASPAACPRAPDAIAAELAANRADLASRRRPRRSPATRPSGPGPPPSPTPTRRRAQPTPSARPAQRARLALPLLPTTTIGSFPQTAELRTGPRRPARRAHRRRPAYESASRPRSSEVIAFQEQARPRRAGARRARTQRHGPVLRRAARPATSPPQHGWVQSYGTRYVRPPILAGDVSRPEPMTVRWTTYAQSPHRPAGQGHAHRPGHHAAPGPSSATTSRSATPPRQVALALRDEVHDLEAAGTAVIQVDEPALRETLPLRAAGPRRVPGLGDRGVPAQPPAGSRADTQIHTHMCYAEFGDILPRSTTSTPT